MELILDASSDSATVGLASQGTLIWDSGTLPPQQHTQRLLPEILLGLSAASTAFGSVELIVVALGPGPFNGLRVATAIAKGIAVGVDAALVGIPTLHAEAYRCPPSHGTIRPIMRAGRAGFATALYAWRDGSWQQLEAEHLIDDPASVTDTSVPVHFSDDIDVDTVTISPRTQNASLRVTGTTQSRLVVLADMGWRYYCAGATTAPAALQPLYVRPPHITSPRNRRP